MTNLHSANNSNNTVGVVDSAGADISAMLANVLTGKLTKKKNLAQYRTEMENEFLEKVLDFHSLNNWREVLRLNENSQDTRALKILWVWPSETNLKFLKQIFDRYCVEGLTSLGCGCGLLEWIISQYTGLPVVGLEINRQWWESKYSITPFIPLRYAEEEIIIELDPKYALLFCYFNDRAAFRKYVKNYRGSMIIIIGPHDGSGRHTDPQPFNVDFGDSKWELVAHQEIKNTKDFIAIYLRESNKK